MLKALVEQGELGEIYCVYGNRVNLGQLRSDENALWSLGAHDVSVLLHIVQEEPYEVPAHGECYVREGVEDVVFCYPALPLRSGRPPPSLLARPHKERRFTIVGSKRMATFDDMAMEGKLTVYDKGFDEDTRSYGEYIARSGDMFCPRVPNTSRCGWSANTSSRRSRPAPRPARTATVACAWCACSSGSRPRWSGPDARPRH